jgi:hypothetical protein
MENSRMPDVPSSDFERLKNAVARLRTTVDEAEALIKEIESATCAAFESFCPDKFAADLEAALACPTENEWGDDAPVTAETETAEPEEQLQATEEPEPVEVAAEELVAAAPMETPPTESGLEVPFEEEVPLALSQDEIGDVLQQMAAMATEVDVNNPDAEPEPMAGETIDISEMIAQQTPVEPVVPPSTGGTVLNEAELMAMLAEAETRAEEYSEEGEAAQLHVVTSDALPAQASVTERDPETVSLVPPVLALAALAVPMRRNGDRLQMVAAEPIDSVAIQNIEAQIGMGVDVEARPMPEILELLRAIYKDGQVPV